MSRGNKPDVLSNPSFRRTPSCLRYLNLLKLKDDTIQEYEIRTLDQTEAMDETLNMIHFNEPFITNVTKNSLGMTLPESQLSLFDVANILGEKFQIKVIEVGNQQQLDNWTIGDYARYFHNYTQSHKILNLISLECSETKLGELVEGPRMVRKADWIDRFWPVERRLRKDYPRVQKYCLAGMAGAYTDFHVDLGGTSVWYHVVRGSKRFYVIPPTVRNLKTYLSWSCSASQDSTFLGDLVGREGVGRVDIHQGQTLLVPSGWIHAVFTPQDSIVFGGNFLCDPCIFRQLQVYVLEERSHVSKQYRFPRFQQMCLYALAGILRCSKRDREAWSDGGVQGGGVGPLRWLGSVSPEDQRAMLKQVSLLTKCSEQWLRNAQADDELVFREIAKDVELSLGPDVRNVGLHQAIGEESPWMRMLDLLIEECHLAASAVDTHAICSRKIAGEGDAEGASGTGFECLASFLSWVGLQPSQSNRRDNDGEARIIMSRFPQCWNSDLLSEELEAAIDIPSPFRLKQLHRPSLVLRLSRATANSERLDEGKDIDGDDDWHSGSESSSASNAAEAALTNLTRGSHSWEDDEGEEDQEVGAAAVVNGTTPHRLVLRLSRTGAACGLDENEYALEEDPRRRYGTRGKRLSAAYLRAVTDSEIRGGVGEDVSDDDYEDEGAAGKHRRTGDDSIYVSEGNRVAESSSSLQGSTGSLATTESRAVFESETADDGAFEAEQEGEEEEDFEERETFGKRGRAAAFHKGQLSQASAGGRLGRTAPIPASRTVSGTGRKPGGISIRQALMKKMGKR